MPRVEGIDVKQAIAAAKAWLTDILADENPINVGLDEIEYDEEANQWKITMGFSRPWNTIAKNALTTISGTQGSPRRSYRVLAVDAKTGDVVSMLRRTSDDD